NLVYEENGELKKVKAEDVTTRQLNVPRNGICDCTDYDISDNLLKLLIAISADFTIRSTGDIYGCFKKERKFVRIIEILDSLGLRYSSKMDSR
ncbi:hypothetical protein ACI3PL_21080, partial [Lacticaseibacillus paracasei]